MLFNSLTFFYFFIVVTVGYYVLPFSMRNVWLLVASYYFYISWNTKYVFLIILATATTYSCGIIIEKIRLHVREDKQKLYTVSVLTMTVTINLLILIYFKYLNFIMSNLSKVFGIITGDDIQLPLINVLLPVGISFYTFQAIGYVADVYSGKVKAEKNIVTYSLFLSFFPQLVAGPIERSGNLISQFYEKHFFNMDLAISGCLQMLWGLFMKMIIADRVAIIVDTVFSDYIRYNGVQITVAVMLFALQIYCDFGGYSNIAIGAARIMGFRLMKNFEQPYLALSVRDFWRRWHISLTKWFTDYVYIPLGGSRKGELRKKVNTMIVFLLSGFWHGSAWHFVMWGV